MGLLRKGLEVILCRKCIIIPYDALLQWAFPAQPLKIWQHCWRQQDNHPSLNRTMGTYFLYLQYCPTWTSSESDAIYVYCFHFCLLKGLFDGEWLEERNGVSVAGFGRGDV